MNPQQVIEDQNAGRWVQQPGGQHRWWTGECWTDYYTGYPHDPVAVAKAMSALEADPPAWKKQEDGRLRWWAGTQYTDNWKDDPEVQAALEAEAEAEAAEVLAVTAAASVAPARSAADEIRQLAELHQGGMLTDEEFAAAKKKALGI